MGRRVCGFALGLFAATAVAGATTGLQSSRSTPDSTTGHSSPAAQMHEALASAQHGDPARALALVDSLLRQTPAYAPASKLRGMLLEDRGDSAGAAVAYQTALKFAPNDPDMLLKVGILELVSGNIEKAIALLERRVRAVPGDDEGNYYLAQAYHLNGNNALALTSIRKAVKAAPQDPPILQKYGELLCSGGDNAQALEWLGKAQHLDPTLQRINFDLAVASYNNMDLNAAAGYASHEAEVDPQNLADLTLLASVQMKLGAWQAAKANLQTILHAKSDDASATLQLGHCDLELKNFQEAIDALHRSLQIDPTQVQAHYLLSRAYSALGETSEAQHEAALHREMMQHISFAMPKAELRREAALSQKAQQLVTDGHETQALQLFQTGPESGVPGGSAWVSVGAAYYALGNTQAAERCFLRAQTLDSRTPGVHAYLGTLALERGDLEEAERNLLAEIALDPNHQLALGELGEVRYRQGRWSEAADLLTRSRTTIPSLLFFLCAADFQLGRTQAANLAAEAVAAYGKDEPAILEALSELLKRNGQTELASRLGAKS